MERGRPPLRAESPQPPAGERREERLRLLRERELAARERGPGDHGDHGDRDHHHDVPHRPYAGYSLYAYAPYSVFSYGYGFGYDPFWVYPYTWGYPYSPYYPYATLYEPYVVYEYDDDDDGELAAPQEVGAVPIEVGTQVEAGDFVVADDRLAVEQVTEDVIRVTWTPPGRAVREVSLFLADENHVVLAVQTAPEAPFGVVFEPPPSTGYVGASVTWDDGTQSTGLLRYVGPPAE